MRNKKGNVVADTLLVVVALFLISVVALLAHSAQESFNTELQKQDNVDADVKAYMQDTTDSYARTWDGLFIFCFVLLWIFVFTASFLVDSHPLFFGISLALLIFVFTIAGMLGNAFYDISTADGLAAYALDFPRMSFIMNHIVEFILAVAFTTCIGLFGKGAFE